MNKNKRGSAFVVVISFVGAVMLIGAGWFVWQWKDEPASSSSANGEGQAVARGGSDCGTIDMSKLLKDPLNYGESTFDCFGKAITECRAAKITYTGGGKGDFVSRVEGRSGANCTTSDTGGLNLATNERRGGMKCSFPVAAAEEVFSKTNSYSMVWKRISVALLYPGTNAIGESYNATCELE